jgi:hydroxyethylthiazole kinase-like uncharacterized protein yjeF
MIKVTKDILKKIYKPRPPEAHKYDYGLLLVIGGSQFYSGSPALSSLAAFRAGVDMVYTIAPRRAADIIASFSPNLACYPLEGERLNEKHLSTLLEMTKSAEAVSEGKTAVVIGGGMGRSPEVQKTIIEYLSKIKVKAVIDADAIHAVAQMPQILESKPFLITCHAFEFLVLTGKKVHPFNIEERLKLVVEEAKRLKTTIILKGHKDIIASYNENEVAIVECGNPLMTVGGTGDTLAGIAGAILSRGEDCFTAGCASLYINGKAGELAAKKFGESMTATDLIEEIPQVIKSTSFF